MTRLRSHMQSTSACMIGELGISSTLKEKPHDQLVTRRSRFVQCGFSPV